MEIDVGEERPSCFSPPISPLSFLVGDFNVPLPFNVGDAVLPRVPRVFRFVGLRPFCVRVGDEVSWNWDSFCPFVIKGEGLTYSLAFSPATNFCDVKSKTTISLSSLVSSRIPPKMYIFWPHTTAVCPLRAIGLNPLSSSVTYAHCFEPRSKVHKSSNLLLSSS